MTPLSITIGDARFAARLETARAPRTCSAFAKLLPFTSRVVHARWSGEAIWCPLGDLDLDIATEDPTSYPAPGQILFYPGGASETEILIPYGPAAFASKAGRLAGTHFLTIENGFDRLADVGRAVLWNGARPIRFELER
jgi:hypothetical protein